MTEPQPEALTDPPAQDVGDENPDAMVGEEVIADHDLDVTLFEVTD